MDFSRGSQPTKFSHDSLAFLSQNKIQRSTSYRVNEIPSKITTFDTSVIPSSSNNLKDHVFSSTCPNLNVGMTTPRLSTKQRGIHSLVSNEEDLWKIMNVEEKMRTLISLQREIQVCQTTNAVEEKFYSVDTYKTEMCKSWGKNGECSYEGKCLFAHGHHELRKRVFNENYKTKMCNNFHKVPPIRHCPYGNRCRYIHDLTEMKEINQKKSVNPEERKKLDERKQLLEKLMNFDLVQLTSVMDSLPKERRNLLIRPSFGIGKDKSSQAVKLENHENLISLIFKSQKKNENRGGPNLNQSSISFIRQPSRTVESSHHHHYQHHNQQRYVHNHRRRKQPVMYRFNHPHYQHVHGRRPSRGVNNTSVGYSKDVIPQHEQKTTTTTTTLLSLLEDWKKKMDEEEKKEESDKSKNEQQQKEEEEDDCGLQLQQKKHQVNPYYYGGGGEGEGEGRDVIYSSQQQQQQQQQQQTNNTNDSSIPKFIWKPLPHGLPKLSPLKKKDISSSSKSNNDDDIDDDGDDSLKSIFEIFATRSR